jgi:hypothetical protein
MIFIEEGHKPNLLGPFDWVNLKQAQSKGPNRLGLSPPPPPYILPDDEIRTRFRNIVILIFKPLFLHLTMEKVHKLNNSKYKPSSESFSIYLSKSLLRQKQMDKIFRLEFGDSQTSQNSLLKPCDIRRHQYEKFQILH